MGWTAPVSFPKQTISCGQKVMEKPGFWTAKLVFSVAQYGEVSSAQN